MAKLSGALFTLSWVLALSANILVLCGLAALQNVCHTGNEVPPTNGSPVQCSKAYRFEWWGFALQCAFLLLVVWNNWIKNVKSAGTMVIGATSTVLAMIFANGFLNGIDALRGESLEKEFGRTTLTFVGFMCVAVGNYFIFLLSDCDTAAAECAKPAEAAVPAKAPGATVTV